METERIGAHVGTELDRQRVVGTLGLVVAISIAVVLGVHPLGSTELYDDGVRFTDHVGPFWVSIHFVGGLLLLAIPVIIGAWADTFTAAAPHVFGRLAATVSVGAAALGVLHLAGTDTVTFLTYQDTLARGVDGAAAGADVLLRIHAATLSAFVMSMFVALPGAAALACVSGRDRTWRFWLPLAITVLSVASLIVTLAAGQWTSLSEMGLFRPAVTLFVIWLGLISYELRRAAATQPDSSPSSSL